MDYRCDVQMRHFDVLSRSNMMVLETNTFEENLIICQGKDEKLAVLRESL